MDNGAVICVFETPDDIAQWTKIGQPSLGNRWLRYLLPNSLGSRLRNGAEIDVGFAALSVNISPAVMGFRRGKWNCQNNDTNGRLTECPGRDSQSMTGIQHPVTDCAPCGNLYFFSSSWTWLSSSRPTFPQPPAQVAPP